jgi:hypothetical protein
MLAHSVHSLYHARSHVNLPLSARPFRGHGQSMSCLYLPCLAAQDFASLPAVPTLVRPCCW